MNGNWPFIEMISRERKHKLETESRDHRNPGSTPGLIIQVGPAAGGPLQSNVDSLDRIIEDIGSKVIAGLKRFSWFKFLPFDKG